MNDVALIGMPNAGKTSLLVTWGKLAKKLDLLKITQQVVNFFG